MGTMLNLLRSLVLERHAAGTFIRLGSWEAFVGPRGQSLGFDGEAPGERSFTLLGWPVLVSRTA